MADSDVVRRLGDLEERVDELEHTVNGNGAEGLAEYVRTNTRALDALTVTVNKIDSTVDQIRKERTQDAAIVQGRLSVVKWIQWGVLFFAAVVGAAGSLGLLRVDQQFRQVQQQLQAIPAIPE